MVLSFAGHDRFGLQDCIIHRTKLTLSSVQILVYKTEYTNNLHIPEMHTLKIPLRCNHHMAHCRLCEVANLVQRVYSARSIKPTSLHSHVL